MTKKRQDKQKRLQREKEWQDICKHCSFEEIKEKAGLLEYCDFLPLRISKKSGELVIDPSSFGYALDGDNVDSMKYFLSVETYQKKIFSDPSYLYNFFHLACRKSAFRVVEFLLDNSLYTEPSIYAGLYFLVTRKTDANNKIFMIIANHNDIKIDFTSDDYELFKMICSSDNQELMSYLIKEKKIHFNEKMQNWLNGNNIEKVSYANIIDKLRLYNHLEKTVGSSEKIQIKHKI